MDKRPSDYKYIRTYPPNDAIAIKDEYISFIKELRGWFGQFGHIGIQCSTCACECARRLCCGTREKGSAAAAAAGSKGTSRGS